MCPTPLRLSHFFTPLTWTQVSIQHFVFSPTRKWFLMIVLPLNLTCSVFILPVNIGSLNRHPRFSSGTSVSSFNSFLQLSTFLSSDTTTKTPRWTAQVSPHSVLLHHLLSPKILFHPDSSGLPSAICPSTTIMPHLSSCRLETSNKRLSYRTIHRHKADR